MEKISSSSSYDVIVIRQPNQTYKSMPFQVVFSSSTLKIREKSQLDKSKVIKEPQMFVNQQLVDIPIKMDPASGRIQFQKKYIRKSHFVSDSSDPSDDERSHRSTSREKLMGKSNLAKSQKIEELKNEQAPKNFWQFAWLFNRKKQQQVGPAMKQEPEEDSHNLSKIKEELYEGEESSKEALFHLSLCGNLLKNKEKSSKEEILKIFFKNKVEYQDFIKDPPAYINDNNLVVFIDDSIYTWQLGIAILTCRFAYGKELSRPLIDDMIKNKFTKSKFWTYFSGSNVTKLDISAMEEEAIKKNKFSSTVKNGLEETNCLIKYRKTPDSETISKMNLQYGENKVKFVLDLGNNANEEVQMKIFLWHHNERIIISDIDGTITKSDILGQILSNYIHTGVSKLYHEIYHRNYKIIYMTARAIGQYKMTRKFLEEVIQNGVKLPEGPLVMSPDGYIASFKREVIDKTPDVLKTKLLTAITELFPHTRKPLFAGFGNRETDNIAYLRLNISLENIFCVSEKSIITNQNKKDFATNYPEMLDKIQDFFPVYVKKQDSENLSENNVPMALGNNISENKNATKNSSDVEDQLLYTNEEVKRKLSLTSEFQEGESPLRKKKESLEEAKNEEKKISRTRSEEGNYNDEDLDISDLMGFIRNSPTSKGKTEKESEKVEKSQEKKENKKEV